MSQIMPAPRAAPVIIATITIASSELLSTSLHAGTTTTPTPRRTEPSPPGHPLLGVPVALQLQRVTATGHQQRVKMSRERKWKGVGGRRTERRLQKRANCPAGRNRQGRRVIRERRQSLYVHKRLCRTCLVPRLNTRSPRAFQNLKAYLLLQARALSTSCCVDRTGQILRKLLVLLNRLVQPCHKPSNLVGLSTDGSIPFPSVRQCSKPLTGLQEKKPYLAPPSVSSIELMRLSA